MNMLVRIQAPSAAPEPVLPPAQEPVEAATTAPRPGAPRRGAAASEIEREAFALLDRDERLVILLSRGRSRLAAFAGSWIARLDRRLPAASPEGSAAGARAAQLAALRRFAILYRLEQGGLAFEEEARLARAGYSESQAEIVRALVDRFGAEPAAAASPWLRILGLLALAAGGTFLLQRWLDAGVEDGAVSLLLSIVIATGVTSFLAVTAHPGGSRPARPRK